VSRVEPKDIVSGSTHKTVQMTTDRGKQQVDLALFKNGEQKEIWMYVKSEQKRQKERSINEKLQERFEEDMQQAADALHKKGGIKNIYKVWQRIGRIKDAITWSYQPPQQSTTKQQGIYFIRTNIEQAEEKLIWDIYNTIRTVESTFRCLKTDLNVRPVFHQNEERIKSHIYLTLLAYQLANTIRHMLKQAGIYHSWSTIVKMMHTQRMTTETIELRTPTIANTEQKQIYKATNCKATKPATKKYVVYH